MMKKFFCLLMTVILTIGVALADWTTYETIIPARNKKIAQIIVIEDGSPRSTETGRVMKDGDNSFEILTSERLGKKPYLIRVFSLSYVGASIQVIPGQEDPEFENETKYVEACLRYFDKKGHYVADLDGFEPEEAATLGAIYCSMARFHSSVNATKVAEVLFNGGAKISIGYTKTYERIQALDGSIVTVEKRHYAIIPDGTTTKPAKPTSPTKPTNTPTPTDKPTPTPTPTDKPTPTPTPTPTDKPTPTPTPTDKPTPTPTPTSAPTATPKPTNTPNPQLPPADFDESLFDDVESSTPAPTPAPTAKPTPEVTAPPPSSEGQPNPELPEAGFDESFFE